jgi:sugar/nucleoside kinase (ribokinase family)
MTPKITCLGDLMRAIIVPLRKLPRVHETRILDWSCTAAGGSAFNICRFLRQAGISPRLVAICGASDRSALRRDVARSRLHDARLIEVPGNNDLLVAFANAKVSRSIYLRSAIPARARKSLKKAFQGEILIFCGTRHRAVRDIALQQFEQESATLRVFSPSYSVYAFDRKSLRRFLDASDLVIFNRQEARFVRRKLGLSHTKILAEKCPNLLVTTLAASGSVVWSKTQNWKIASVSNRAGDVIGAGDAYLAGFIVGMTRNWNPARCGRFASKVAARIVRVGTPRAKIDRRMFRLSK